MGRAGAATIFGPSSKSHRSLDCACPPQYRMGMNSFGEGLLANLIAGVIFYVLTVFYDPLRARQDALKVARWVARRLAVFRSRAVTHSSGLPAEQMPAPLIRPIFAAPASRDYFLHAQTAHFSLTGMPATIYVSAAAHGRGSANAELTNHLN
jgi:hypothetical protein